MKRSASSLTIALLIGLVIGLLLNGNQAIGQGQGSGGGNLGAHHQHLQFTVPNQQPVVFPIPAVDTPVSIEFSISSLVRDDGPMTMEPKSMFVTYDSGTGRIMGGVSEWGGGNLKFVDGDESSLSLLCPGGLGEFTLRQDAVGSANLRIEFINVHSSLVSSQVTYKFSMWY